MDLFEDTEELLEVGTLNYYWLAAYLKQYLVDSTYY